MFTLNLLKIRCLFFKNTFYLFTFALCFSNAFSQESISGYVLDVLEKPVEGANIVVTDNQDRILKYTFSDATGFYRVNFDQLMPSKVLVVASGLGLTTNKQVLVKEDSKFNYNVSFILAERIQNLEEVVLRPKEKISKSGNVTTIQVEPFKDGTEQTIEDILRDLPGIEILADGSIKAHGRFISKLLVEGEDIFDDNYKILSKNLDAKVLGEVEIIESFEPNPVLSKVIESENIALNLILKEEYKNVWFGNVSFGLGNQNRLNSAANIGLIRKKFKALYIGDYNNLGQTATSQLTSSSNTINVNTILLEKKIEPSLSPIYSISPVRINQMENEDMIFNEASLNTVSFVSNLGSTIKIRGTGGIANDSESQLIFRQTVFNIGTEPITYSEEQNAIFDRTHVFGEIELQHLASDNTYFKNLTVFDFNPGQTKTLNLFNENIVSQYWNERQNTFNNHFNSSQLILNKYVFHNYLYFGIQNIKQNGNLVSPTLNEFLGIVPSQELRHIVKDRSNTYGIISTLVMTNAPFKQTFELSYHWDRTDRVNQLINLLDNRHIDTFENNQLYSLQKFGITHKSNYNLSKNIHLSTHLSLENISLDLEGKPTSNWQLNPSMVLGFKNFGWGTFTLDFQRDTNDPLPNYFLENNQLSGYQSLKKGSRGFSISRYNQFGFNYQIGNQMKTKRFTMRTRLRNIEGQYAQNVQIDKSIIQTSYQFVEGGKSRMVNLDYTSYYEPLNFSSNIGTNIIWSKLPYRLNTEEFLYLESLSRGINVSGTTYFQFPINFGFEIDLQWIRTDFNGETSRTQWTDISSNIVITVNNEIAGSITNKYLKMPNANYFNIGFDFNYVPEGSKFSYRVIANNLTNQGDYIVSDIDQYTTASTKFKLLPRYVLASIKYRF